jgi:hypothetical protein
VPSSKRGDDKHKDQHLKTSELVQDLVLFLGDGAYEPLYDVGMIGTDVGCVLGCGLGCVLGCVLGWQVGCIVGCMLG